MRDARKVSAGQDAAEVGAGRRPVLDSYARLSMNLTGELEKTDDQHAENLRSIARLGGVLGERLTDDDLSAWKRGVVRRDWETLLGRLESGESDGVVVWHLDRLMRQPWDLERLLKLSDRGLVLGSSRGKYDLSDSNDRFILRVEVAHACRSSDDTSRRIKFRNGALRRQGIPHKGPRPFGFPGADRTARGEDGERVPVPAELVERERVALQKGTAAVLAGVFLSTVAAEWNAAGLATSTGARWTSLLVRAVLVRPRNAGWVEHNGLLVARMPGEPIVAPELFDRLLALMAGRRQGRSPGDVYAGSGVLRCGLCRAPLGGRPHVGSYPDGERRRQYHCAKQRGGCGRVAADMRKVDVEVRRFVVQRLSDPRHAASIAAARSQTALRLGEVEREIRQCETIQKAMADRLGRREITLDAFDQANTPLTADLTRLTVERDALAAGEPVGPSQALDAGTVAAQWDDGDPTHRRAMLTQALGRARLVLDPAPQRGTFNPTRVRLILPDQDTAPDV